MDRIKEAKEEEERPSILLTAIQLVMIGYFEAAAIAYWRCWQPIHLGRPSFSFTFSPRLRRDRARICLIPSHAACPHTMASLSLSLSLSLSREKRREKGPKRKRKRKRRKSFSSTIIVTSDLNDDPKRGRWSSNDDGKKNGGKMPHRLYAIPNGKRWWFSKHDDVIGQTGGKCILSLDGRRLVKCLIYS